MSQLEELENLTVIYKPEDFQFVRDTTTSLITGWYYAHPKLPQKTPTLQARIRVTSQITKLFPFTHPQFERLNGVLYKTYLIDYPPPVLVKFTLPQGYPEKEAPLLRLECMWIPPFCLDEIVSQLNIFASCKIGEQCLWECFDYLECELLSSLLGLPREGDSLVYDVSEKIPHRRVRDSALASIVGYDALEKRRQFRESKVECEVCMDEDKLGAECTRLSGCEHVFCHECLREALKSHMADGVTAGTFRCLGCNSLVDLNEVKEFATPEQYERYDELLLQRCLSMMEDVVRCPRAGCSGTCLADDEYLARCPVCQHSFCPRCLRPYHRGTACKQSATADAGESDDEEEEEDDADEKDDEGRLLWRIAHEQDPAKRMLLLERQVLVLGRPTEDLVALNRFKKTYKNRCPTCRVFVDKISGCDNVFCPICKKGFIYGIQEAQCQPDSPP